MDADIQLFAGAHRALPGRSIDRRSKPALGELDARDETLVHLVGAVGEAQGPRACAKIAASGVSCDSPAPPWIWMASSTTRCSTFGATTLMAEISVIAARAPTWSIFQAAYSVSSRA